MSENVRITNLPTGKAEAAINLADRIWDYRKDGKPSDNKDKYLKLVYMSHRAVSGLENDPWDE